MKFASAFPLMLAILAYGINGENLSKSGVRGLKRGNKGRRVISKGSSKNKNQNMEAGNVVEEEVLDGVVGAIFSATNVAPLDDNAGPLGNELVMYHQFSDGSLKGPVGRYQTGGTGINFASSQNSIIVSGNQVFVANGSSNPFNDSPEGRTSGSVSRFVFDEFGALLTSEVLSGGENPTALALCGRILYVANGAFLNGLNLIVGFEPPHPAFNSTITALYVEDDGSLIPLPDLTQDLGPSRVVDIVLSPDNRNLVVAASVSSAPVVSYELDDKCALTGVSSSIPPQDAEPGSVSLSTLQIGGKNYVYSGNIFGGSVSAFQIDSGGDLELVNVAMGAGPAAGVCWTAIVGGKYLYTANTLATTVSSFEIDQDDGSVTRLELAAAESSVESNTGAGPTDMYVDGNILYVLFANDGEIYVYHAGEDGKLTLEQTIGGLPAGSDRFPAGLALGKFRH